MCEQSSRVDVARSQRVYLKGGLALRITVGNFWVLPTTRQNMGNFPTNLNSVFVG